MDPEFWYYLWAITLLVANLCAWASTLITLPGNWCIVLATVLFAAFVRYGSDPGVNWWVVAAITLLAVVGEGVEFLAGAAGAAKQGGSRRGMALAITGSMIGSLCGAFAGVPVPVIGPMIGALGGGAAGAFAGAYVGEAWKGKTSGEMLAISKAALLGRLLGTVGKLAIGMIMVVIVAFATFFH